LDITVIPKTTNENVKLIVSILAKIVKIEVKEEHINKTYRLRYKDENNSHFIVELVIYKLRIIY
jgi:hypothetical protein